MANPETPLASGIPSPANPVITRRRVLGGIAGVGGLAAASALLAACSSSSSNSPAASAAGGGGAASASAPGASAAAGGSAPAASLSGEVTLGSNYSDEVPKKAMQAAADSFKAKTGPP